MLWTMLYVFQINFNAVHILIYMRWMQIFSWKEQFNGIRMDFSDGQNKGVCTLDSKSL